MNISPLCIIQARMKSTRLPGKMLLPIGDDVSLVARAWRLACAAFDDENCLFAIPASDADGPLGNHLVEIGARWMRYDGSEADVLGRFHYVAHSLRWHPQSVLVRWTPDDPFKDPSACRRVAAGQRLPVELGAEAFTLAMLDAAHASVPLHRQMVQQTIGVAVPASTHAKREHLTDILFPFRMPSPQGAGWTVDTADDYNAARARVGQ